MTDKIQDIITQLNDLRLKHMGQALARDLDTMSEAERVVMLKFMGKWAATEKSERKTQLIASLFVLAAYMNPPP